MLIRRKFRVLVVGIAAACTSTLLADPASAQSTTLDYQCRMTSAGGDVTFDEALMVDVSAPSTVGAGQAVTVVVDPAPFLATDPSLVKELRQVEFRMAAPTNSRIDGTSLSGGDNLGPEAPTLRVDGGEIVLTVPGPINSGRAIELPTVTLQLTAGAAGSIETRVSGTGFDRPGITALAAPTANPSLRLPTTCFPDLSPVLSRTAIQP